MPPQIYCAPTSEKERLELNGEDFHHVVKVLRHGIGDEVSVYFDGETNEYRYGIDSIGRDSAEC